MLELPWQGFGFVTSDITTKLAILEGHLKNRDKANGNTTLQKMMDYEKVRLSFCAEIGVHQCHLARGIRIAVAR
jgi:hypothetical protein